MNNDLGVNVAQRLLAGQPCPISFVQPVLACIIAATRLANDQTPNVRFDGDSRVYAEHSGLAHAMHGRYEAMVRPRSSSEGHTWSRLSTLHQHAEIEACNKTINDLLFAQLTSVPRSVLDAAARVVGELHDNVASHANGRGFSSAQFYQAHRSHPARLELAIADFGCGFLRHVRAVVPNITTHADAIRWCLKKGNTAWQPPRCTSPTDWADPYAEAESRSGQRDHHMGYGLSLLTELVRGTQGTLWLWTGDASYTVLSNGLDEMKHAPIAWPGVVIEVTLYPDRVRRVDLDPLAAKLGSLAKELGL
jgi:hypothetical protein